MPISVQGKKKEWNRILTMARNNGYPTQLLHGMKKQRIAKKEGTQTRADQQHSRKCVTFTFHSPSIHKITNLFKKTNLKIAFRPTKHNISATLKQKQGSQPHRHLPTQMQYVQPCVCRTVWKTNNHTTQRTPTLHKKQQFHLSICYAHSGQQT